ncbi:MAG TPA: hypothetical protein VKQ07_04690 [Jatrophihabitantaceae bacterium]|nr:hypothetical protein [Jatrophihabitantaceae bacterium]
MSATDVPARWWAGTSASSRTADTAADMQLYVEIGLAPVQCTACGTEVLVKKNSPKHTSVQWTSDAAASCPEIRAQIEAGVSGGQVLGCARLKQSIDDAVRRGELTVPHD